MTMPFPKASGYCSTGSASSYCSMATTKALSTAILVVLVATVALVNVVLHSCPEAFNISAWHMD